MTSKDLNFELALYNDTSLPIKAKINTSNTNNFIDDTAGYSLAVPRFSVDISNIPIHIIKSNDDDYKISIVANTMGKLSPVISPFVEASSYMYNTPIYSPTDFIENVNRTLNDVHQKLIVAYSYQSAATTTNRNFTEVIRTVDITVPQSPGVSTQKAAYVKFSLNIQSSELGNIPINIDITNPSGFVCRVASGITITYPLETYYFNMNGEIQPTDSSIMRLKNGVVYQPVESFSKFSNYAGAGTWIVTIIPSGMNVGLGGSEYFINTTNINLQVGYAGFGDCLGVIPPLVSLDSDGYINWAFHEQFINNKLRIKLGLALQNILKIQKDNGEYLRLPIIRLSDTRNEIRTIKSELANIYGINQLEKIQLYSETLKIDNDYTDGAQKSGAIMSFLLPNDGVEKFSDVTYAVDPIQWRRYKFKAGGMPLRDFDIEVKCSYKNGNVVNVQIYPRKTFNILLNFHKD